MQHLLDGLREEEPDKGAQECGGQTGRSGRRA